MLHAAAMLIGLLAISFAFMQGWQSPAEAAFGLGAALAGVLIAARFGGLGRGGSFARAPRIVLLALRRSGAVLSGALATIRASLAADIALKPALVRVKLRPSSDFARTVLANMIGAAPGEIVVEADGESLLVHVLDEDAIDAAGLGRLEARVTAALDGAP